VIERVRPDDPPAYLSVMASVVRNASDAEAEDPFASMTIEELKAEVLSWGLPVCSRSFELFRQSTVGDIRWLGAKSVMLLCQACQHRQIANVELLPDDVTLALIASKFVCPNCHQNGAHALPNWDAAPNQPPAASEGQES
jgi:hypothetical protein